MKEYVELGEFIEKGNSGEIVMLGFPHFEPQSRSLIYEKPGRYLGPHCLMRFLPKIALLPKGIIPKNVLSHLGDVIRPKQFLQHRYKTLKSSHTHEELLEFTEKLIKEKVYDFKKELIFFGSYFETFPYIVKSDINSKHQNIILIFSPFLYLERHYNDTNIRTESSMRMFIEYLNENQIKSFKIIYLGTKNSFITKNEKKFLKTHQDYVEIHPNETINQEFLEIFFKRLKTENADIYVGFSFNVVDPQYFWGRNHLVINSNFDNKLLIRIFRELGKIKIKLLSFYDFNPQEEDFISGIFYSTLIYEYLQKRLKI